MMTLNSSSLTLLLLLTFSLVSLSDATCHTETTDCVVKPGKWSDCDPCTKIKSRHLEIEQHQQFGGYPCPTTLVDHETCTTRKPCPVKEICSSDQFNCGFLGRCLPQSLKCNGEDDCGNNADEQNCSTDQHFPRSIQECLDLEHLPYLDQIGSGFSFVAEKPAGRVFDHQRFMGFCRKAADGNENKVYRLPYNVDDFHFPVKASDDLEVKTHYSLSEYTKEQDEESSVTWNEKFSIGGTIEIFSGEITQSMSYTQTHGFKSIYSAMKEAETTMFQVSSAIEMAKFVLREDDLLLDSFFEQRLINLPSEFNAKSYFDFFNHYGPFYVHSGILGGRYIHHYIIKNTDMQKTQLSMKTWSECLKISMSATIGVLGFGGSTKELSRDSCAKKNGKEVTSSELADTASHKIVSIDGGTTQVAGKLAGAATLGNGTQEETKYGQWVLGVQKNPVLLKKTLRPICNLLFSAKDPQNKTEKYQVCLQATAKYLQPHSTVGCKSCSYGRPLNIFGQCVCACQSNYTGQTCSSHIYKKHHSINFKIISKEADNPPTLQQSSIGQQTDKAMMKMKGNRIFVLLKPTGESAYKIKEYDEFLSPIRSTVINLKKFKACDRSSFFCVWDFDVDSHGNFILSLDLTSTEGQALFKVDRTGEEMWEINRPCMMDGSSDSDTPTYLTVTCTDHIIITCPLLPLATVKVFNGDGEARHIKFLGWIDSQINGIQYFDGSLWVHTGNNEVAKYDLDTWEQSFVYSGLRSSGNYYSDMSTVSVDHVGHLIIGQDLYYGNDYDKNLTYKFTIVEGSGSKSVLAHVLLEKWNYCNCLATYMGKVYVLCSDIAVEENKSVLVFDYLK